MLSISNLEAYGHRTSTESLASKGNPYLPLMGVVMLPTERGMLIFDNNSTGKVQKSIAMHGKLISLTTKVSDICFISLYQKIVGQLKEKERTDSHTPDLIRIAHVKFKRALAMLPTYYNCSVICYVSLTSDIPFI